MVAKGPAMCKAVIVIALFAIVFSSSTLAQAAEVGTQIYWAPEPGFGVLFLSVRVWPFEGLAVSGGMGETVFSGHTWEGEWSPPSLNAKVLWRFMDQDTLDLQTGVNLTISYWLHEVLMPRFYRVDLLWTLELEYQLTERGFLSVGAGFPVGWDHLVAILELSFHIRY